MNEPTSQSVPPLLVQYLFGEKADTAWSTAGEQLRQWSECFDAWLEELLAENGAKTERERRFDWNQFIQVVRKTPWEAQALDVEFWGQVLQNDGLAMNTVQGKLASLSLFYQFARRYFLRTSGVETPNPVLKARRPRPVKEENFGYLDEEEAQALLAAALRGGSLLSKRDYAFYLCCLKTGLNFRALRMLKWGQLEKSEAAFAYLPYGSRLPEECCQAIRVFLQEAGRWESIADGDTVFAPVADHATVPSGWSQDWDSGRPVSVVTWDRNLKRAADWAGLKAEEINFQTLRNTALYLRIIAGDSAEEIASFMHYLSLKTANRAIRTVQDTQKVPLWAAPDPERQIQRRPRGGINAYPSRLDPLLGPAGPEELERLNEAPAQTLALSVERVHALLDALTCSLQAGVEDIRTLYTINRVVNRATGKIERLAPIVQKYQEAEAKEASDRKRIADLIARLESDPEGELDEDEVKCER